MCDAEISASAVKLIAKIEQHIAACLFGFFKRNRSYPRYSPVSFQVTIFSVHPTICNNPHVLFLTVDVQERAGRLLVLIWALWIGRLVEWNQILPSLCSPESYERAIQVDNNPCFFKLQPRVQPSAGNVIGMQVNRLLWKMERMEWYLPLIRLFSRKHKPSIWPFLLGIIWFSGMETDLWLRITL